MVKKRTADLNPDTGLIGKQEAAGIKPKPVPKHPAVWGEPPLVEPLKEAKLPLPQATFLQHAGSVGEVTWTKEDDVIRFKKWDVTGAQDTLKARYWLRSAAKQGIIVGRRNPEHGYWEYGPQWRAKDFQLMVDAAEAASRLGVKADV